MLTKPGVVVAIILAINIVYVSFFTMRMIFILKGKKYIAALLSTFEILVYIMGLGLVLKDLNQIQNIVAYALGYGLGVLVGMKIEEKLALGYVTVNVITKGYDFNIAREIREKGYGVTSWEARGLEGERLAMQILCPRKYELKLYRTIKGIDPKAFIITHEPRIIHGGFWVKNLHKKRLGMDA